MNKLFTTVVVASTSATSFLFGSYYTKREMENNKNSTKGFLSLILPFQKVNASTALVAQPSIGNNPFEKFPKEPNNEIKTESLQVIFFLFL